MAAEKGLCLTIDYTVEAELQFGDVAYAVKSWKLSQVLECSPSVCHVNVTTKEGITITIRLDSSGFHVLGEGQDKILSEPAGERQVFETVYALMDNISPSYAKSFKDALTQKLAEK